MNQTNTLLTATNKSATSAAPPPAVAQPTAAPQAKLAVSKPQPAQTQPVRRTVRFEVDIPQARRVFVVGTFNDWKPGATRMLFIGGTKWFRELSLASGRYEYRFVADGKWIDDPNAKAYVPNLHGSCNAVLQVE